MYVIFILFNLLNYYKKNFHFFSLLYIRISGKNITFDNKKIKKSEFYRNKKVNIDDIDVNKILVSKTEP